jgi:hypothetical protein
MLGLLIVSLLSIPVPTPLDARGIYLRARDIVNASSVPPYLVFTYNDASHYDMPGWRGYSKERLRIAVRTADGHAFVQTIRNRSGFQGHMEPVVVGDNAVFPNTETYRLGDFPTADFGLRDNETRPGFFDPPSALVPPASADALRVIGKVSAINVPYRLELLKDDSIDGRPMYHLRLAPLRDPAHNVLREMWIDRETFEPRRYVAERFVGSPTLFSYIVTIDEARMSGFILNTSLSGQRGSQVLGHSGDPGVISPMPRELTLNAAWSISDVSFPTTLPNWLFDPDTFRLHKQDPLPVALSAPGVPPSLASIRRLVFDYTTEDSIGSETPDTNALHGTIQIDVVAATADGGLVVDVRQKPGGREPFVRVAIAADGTLSYDERLQLTSEQGQLLKLFGRNVIGPAVRQAGDTWQIVRVPPDTKDDASFRIVEVPGPENELIEITESEGDHAKIGSDSMHGTVRYDPTLSVPTSASFAIERGSAMKPTKMTIDLTLVEDSFAAKRSAREPLPH